MSSNKPTASNTCALIVFPRVYLCVFVPYVLWLLVTYCETCCGMWSLSLDESTLLICGVPSLPQSATTCNCFPYKPSKHLNMLPVTPYHLRILYEQKRVEQNNALNCTTDHKICHSWGKVKWAPAFCKNLKEIHSLTDDWNTIKYLLAGTNQVPAKSHKNYLWSQDVLWSLLLLQNGKSHKDKL